MRCRESFIFFSFYFSNLLSQIYGNLTVGFRRDKQESALRDEGYAWVPETPDFTENSGKNSKKIQIFSFSHIYGILLVGIFVPIIKVTLRGESYA